MINAISFWDFLKEGFLNLIFPLSCEYCGKEIKESKGYAICSDCIKRIEFITSPYCFQCGKPLSSMVDFEDKAICAECHNKKDHFYHARSIAYYRGVMRKCIHLLKYKKQVKLIQPLGKLMVNYLLQENSYIHIDEIDLIIPVPLFRRDYLKRGFNQSGLLARYIADYFSITYTDHCLTKIKENVSQVGLSRIDRKKNVKQVYSVNASYQLNGKNVLLVDDIYTTGATIEACCNELKKIRLKKILVLTLARGI